MHIEPRFSVAQLAEVWGCSRQHVYALINKGELKVVRIGTLLRIRAEDVKAYECRDQEPSAQPIPSRAEAVGTTFSSKRTGAMSGYEAALRWKRKHATP